MAPTVSHENWQHAIAGLFGRDPGESSSVLFRLMAREKSCEKCDRLNSTYSRDFEISSFHRVRTAVVWADDRRLQPSSNPIARRDSSCYCVYVLSGFRERLVAARFRRQGLPFRHHPGFAPTGVAVLGQGSAWFTLRRRNMLGGVPVVDASGYALERMERR